MKKFKSSPLFDFIGRTVVSLLMILSMIALVVFIMRGVGWM
jgi:hypothetical protein